jgi:autotransporter-associated beta strand protein
MVAAVDGAEVDLTPISTTDGLYTQVTVAGQPAWQNTGTSRHLYARRPDSFGFTAGQPLYVRVTYFDDAEGLVDLQYDSQTNAYTTSPLHTRTTRVGSGRFVNGYFELPNVLFNKRQNGSSDFRIITGTTSGAKVPVQRITLADTPFADPDFQAAVARAWQSRYTGPAKGYVDTTTLKGKVMTGYQGWFNTPNDIRDGGWRHWVRNNTMTPENFTIDAWPDLRDYDPAALVRAGNVMTASGEPAYLFSSATYSVVRQHFRWMRKHNIDGAWLQRFHPQAGAQAEWPLRNVSQAAAEEGLVWGVEYDVSGMADATVAAKLQADWEWLTSQFDILDDPRYIHEDGKPVVFIWGLAVPDRNFTTASANAVVDYFLAQGVHVLGGLPTNWNTLDASWQAHMAKYDGVLVWMNKNTPDATFFRNRGQDFYPHIWPGFSWAHLKQLPATPLTQYTDRTGGQFYWSKGRDWINAGATDSLFFGMWDEYDESTQIMPMTDDPPPPHTEWGRFINNQNKPGDWWMMLTDELKRMMLGQRANTNTLPTVESLSNRSNIGPEASVDLGATDIDDSLARVQQGDGNTIVETVGGKECRGNAEPTTTHRYLYFNVNNAFAYQLANGDVTIEVEYYDNTLNTVLGLQYDSTSTVPSNPAYTNHPQPITTTGSNTWRRVRFEIADAFFGGRQNGGSDFRLNFNGKKLNVNRVWVRLPEGKMHPFTWTNDTTGSTLNWSNNGNWLGGIVGQSDVTSTVRVLPGQTLAGGTIHISNNLSGLQLGTLELGGTASSSADTTVTLNGNSLSLGGTAPTLALDATSAVFDLTYDITTPVTLLGATQVSGTGDAALRISGPLSGSGGIQKTSAGPLTLSGANTYLGNTSLLNGKLQLGVADNRLPVTTQLTLGSSGNSVEFDLNGSNQEIAGIAINSGATPSNNTVSNSSVTPATLTVNTVASPSSFAGNLIGNLALTKMGADMLTLNGGNTYTGATRINEGVLKSGVDNALPIGTALSLGSGATVGALDLGTFNQTVTSLAVNSDSGDSNTIAIGTDKTLTVAGSFTVGVNPATTEIVTNLTAAGPGELKITTGNFQLGASNTNNLGNAATLDMSGLDKFTYDNDSGVFRVGTSGSLAVSGNNTATLILADTSTITAASVSTNTSATSANEIRLGSGVNTINAGTISIGLVGGRSSGGYLVFDTTTGTLKVRGLAGDDESRASMTVGYGNATTSTISTNNVVDLTGHDSNLLLVNLQVAGRTNGGNGGPVTATFGFDEGTLDAAGIVVGDRRGNGTTSGNFGLVDGTLNLGGGTVIMGDTGLSVATNTATSAGNSVIGRVNISGGSATVGATSGLSIRLGNNTHASNGGATAELNLTGGTLTVTGDIAKGTATGAVTSTIKLSGGTLDMGGNDIGTLADIITLTAESGTLRNVASINGNGGLTKTTAGTLVLEGMNPYTGDTTVTEGTLELADNAQLKFVIGATSGSNNRITGAGAVVIHGDFDIDTALADASALTSGSWTLVDAATLTETFSQTFNLAGAGWSETSNVWTKTAGAKKYTFTEATGILTLSPAASYASWIAGTFAGGQLPMDKRGPNDDFDNDGIRNLIEYAIAGQDPTVPNPAIGSFTGTTLSFTKRAGTGGLTYVIQESTDLGINDDWHGVSGPNYVNDPDTISYSFSQGTPVKNFLRLQVLAD